ncbi:tellurite resistance TerB family protein [Fulvitalea axinellae]
MIVKPNKTKLRYEFRPASPSLRGITIPSPDLPDPSILSKPVNKLFNIADQCEDALDPYSRYLGRKGNSKDDIEGILLLPEELFHSDNISVLNQFRTWATDEISKQNGGEVKIKDLWGQTGVDIPQKLNKKEISFIQQLLDRLGFGFAPDPRFHHEKPTMDGLLILFHEKHLKFFKPSDLFYQKELKIRLGAMIASADEDVDAQEMRFLQELVDEDDNLTSTEKRSLHAYLKWRLKTPISMTGLKAKLSHLSQKDKSVFSEILIEVALADGTIDPSEIKQIEKTYTALGLDKTTVSSDIHKVTSRNRSGISSQDGAKDTGTFELDHKLINHYETETRDAQKLLSDIFIEEEEETPELQEDVPQVFDSLSPKERELYQFLVEKETWDRKEVNQFCKKLGLMLDGGIESINEWSYEQVDAPLIDDEGEIYVDMEIAKELKELA